MEVILKQSLPPHVAGFPPPGRRSAAGDVPTPPTPRRGLMRLGLGTCMPTPPITLTQGMIIHDTRWVYYV